MSLTVADYLALQANQMTEAQLLDLVRSAVLRLDGDFFHVHDSRHSAAGFPDCVIWFKAPMIATPSTIIVAELKTMRGVVTPDQERWLDHFRSAGIATFVWRPSDWQDGTIIARLARAKEGA